MSRDLTRGGRLSPGPPFGTATRRVVALVAAVAAAMAGCALLTGGPGPATDVDEVQLAGARSPGCVRLLVLSDLSGSMADHAGTRTAALGRILDWAPRNLRPDDELAVIAYAGSADLVLPTTPVADFAGAALPPARLAEPDGTRLDDVVRVVSELPATTCRTTMLFLSDGVLTEEPLADVDEVLGAAGVASVATVVPQGVEMPDAWRALFPYGTEAEVADRQPGRLAVAVAEVLAEATGQEVRRVEP
ncbi:hypothetical protein ACWKWC_04665 [Geodermatophilus nigrescens]